MTGDSTAKAGTTTAIANTELAPITGRLVVESPAGWDQQITSFEVKVAGGAKATEATEVPIPLSLTAGTVAPRAEFGSDSAVLVAASTFLNVPVATAPTAST